MKNIQTQYDLIKEGKGNKAHFMKLARHHFPDLVTPILTYEDTLKVLKNRSIISEGIGGVVTKGTNHTDWGKIFKENIIKEYGTSDYIEDFDQAKRQAQDISKKEGVVQHVNEVPSGGYKISDWYDDDTTLISYENGRQLNEAKEAKVIEKESTKEVTDMETKGYNYKDEKNYDNVFGEQFLKGFYTEMGDSKNEGKTVEELKQIVAKNLAKDINHYVKDGQFGVKGIGYTTEAPGLGTPKEAKGKHKSSGYGDLKESILRAKIYQLIKEELDQSPEEIEFEQATDLIDNGESVDSVANKFPNIDKKLLQLYADEKEGIESGDLESFS